MPCIASSALDSAKDAAPDAMRTGSILEPEDSNYMYTRFSLGTRPGTGREKRRRRS